MGKRFLFLALAINAVLIAVTAVQSRAAVPAELEQASWCCVGGQCVQGPILQCMWLPSCEGNGDCGVF